MKKFLIVFLIAATACEINDVQVIDLENSVPSENKPIILGNKFSVDFLSQSASGNIIFSGRNRMTGVPYVAMRKITGDSIGIELSSTPFGIATITDKVVIWDGDVTVYDENLQYESSYDSNTDSFISGFNKITFGEGTTITQIRDGQMYTSSPTNAGGNSIIFNGRHSLHTQLYTYTIGRAFNSETLEDEFFLIKYDNQFNIESQEIIESISPFFGNENSFYLAKETKYLEYDLYEYTTSGTFIGTIEGFTLPSSSVKYKLLKNGDLAIGSLSIKNLETNETLWTYESEGAVISFDELTNGNLLIAVNYFGQTGIKIFQTTPEY